MFGQAQPLQVKRARLTWRWAAIVVALLVIIAVIFLAGAFSPTTGLAALAPALDAYYDYGNSTVTPSVALLGWVFNNGTAVTSCYLNYTFNDSRGWSLSDSLNLGAIQPSGGYALINKTYAWPQVYKGVSVVSPTPIVPEWTYKITPY